MPSYTDKKKYVKPSHGWSRGDVAYVTKDGVQYQVRLTGILRIHAIANPVMSRHRETVGGVDQGVWCKWVLCGSKPFPIILSELSKTP